MDPANRIAVFYLAELAYAHQEYSQANRFYSLLLSIDSSRTDVEPKRQKALLLATEELLRSAALAEKVRVQVDWYDRAFYSLFPVPPDEARHFVAAIEALL